MVCAECGGQFAGERRTDNHFAEMHAPPQQQEEDIWPDFSNDDDDAEPSTEVEPSREEEEDSEEDTDEEQEQGTEVGFSWRWPPDD